MRWLWLLVLFPNLAWAQNPQCPTRPVGDSSNACASTAFVQAAIPGSIELPNGQILIGSVAGFAAAQAMSQDCTITNAGVITCTKTNNVAFAPIATSGSASDLSTGTVAAARGGAGNVNGALKGNGSGAVSQAACADLSNAAASCSTDATNATNISSGTLNAARLPATATITIASGAKALATSAISSGTCTSAQTDTATGTATTDAIIASFNGDPTGVTGYVPATSGMLTIIVYPTANTVNFKVCNNTSSSITPGAITINWRVVR